MNLKKLTIDIKKDGKITADELSTMMAELIEEEYTPEEIYKTVYEKAYGSALNKHLAECWVHEMSVTDGSDREDGEMWTCEQTTDVGNKVGIDWNVISKSDWYAVLNASYSDFYKTAKKFGHEDDPLFFAGLAKDFWICDDDVKGKTPFSYYFNYVV